MAAVLGVAVVAVLVLAGMGYLVITRNNEGPSPQPSLGPAAASLDQNGPAFPVPASSTLINDFAQGSGVAAYRIESWQSGADYDATVAFYTNLQDSRWQVDGSPVTTPDAADFTFSDGSGVFAKAGLEVARTNPVTIDVRFLPPGGVPAQSFAPGPTIAFGPLPVATVLPDGFPSAFVPAGTKLIDASSIGSTYFAIFGGSVDATLYAKQIAAVASVTGTSTQSGDTVIEFTYDGNPGEAIFDPTTNQVSIQVTK